MRALRTEMSLEHVSFDRLIQNSVQIKDFLKRMSLYKRAISFANIRNFLLLYMNDGYFYNYLQNCLVKKNDSVVLCLGIVYTRTEMFPGFWVIGCTTF